MKAGSGARSTGSRAGGPRKREAPYEVRRRARVEIIWALTRDNPHDAIMVQGLCLRCFGWVDDPRHLELHALPGSTLTARYAFRP